MTFEKSKQVIIIKIIILQKETNINEKVNKK